VYDISQATRKRAFSAAPFSRNKPIFQKLTPVICNDEEEHVEMFKQKIGFNETPKIRENKEIHVDDLSDFARTNHSTIVSSAEIVASRAWGSALKKVKGNVLGYYLDRATRMVNVSKQRSSTDCNPFELKESSSLDTS
jgi:hypothetical protein